MEKEIIRYINLVKYLEVKSINQSKSTEKLLSKTWALLPGNIKSVLNNFTDDNKIRSLINKKPSNKKSYNTFCINVLKVILEKLNNKTCYINKKFFDKTFLSLKVNSQSPLTSEKTVTESCAFIIKNKETNLIFSFGHQGFKNLQRLSNHVFTIDNHQYKNIHVIIFKNSKELNEARQVRNGDLYKRSFLTSFDEICTKVIEIDKASYEKIFSIKQYNTKSVQKSKKTAGLSEIEIINNIPVGKENSKLFKLIFKSESSLDILPGQFIMINTFKEQKERSKAYQPKMVNSVSNITPNIHNELRTKQISYLKRPFGIYRTYSDHFSNDYISKLNLEKELASILYTIKPGKFEIVYKVLDKGLGTNELTKFAKDDKVEILAPLGKVLDLRNLIREDIDEIHIVGGGVGIAPLIHFVQALRYFNIKVKAFVGIENHHSLIYKDDSNGTGKNTKIYIDDLKLLGLSETSDIYVSFLCNTDEDYLDDIKNVFKGSLVTEPYSEYLKKQNNLKIITFTCGPVSMMQKVHDITSKYDIKTYVLMEKRMACGIGVCFSCVCKTIVNGENNYSRVCIDGPVIESNQINWNE